MSRGRAALGGQVSTAGSRPHCPSLTWQQASCLSADGHQQMTASLSASVWLLCPDSEAGGFVPSEVLYKHENTTLYLSICPRQAQDLSLFRMNLVFVAQAFKLLNYNYF